MQTPEFGPFQDAFEKDSNGILPYLTLLNLTSADVPQSVDVVERGIGKDDPAPWIFRLLCCPNWRMHLVGGLAMILDERRRTDPTALWKTIDGGSWVVPQMVATAYIVDPHFAERVRERLDLLCSADFQGSSGVANSPHPSPLFGVMRKRVRAWLTSLDPVNFPAGPPEEVVPLTKYRASFPGTTIPYLAKTVSSLLSIGEHSVELAAYIKRARSNRPIVHLLQNDIDNAGSIASAWLSRITTVIADRGRTWQVPTSPDTAPALSATLEINGSLAALMGTLVRVIKSGGYVLQRLDYTSGELVCWEDRTATGGGFWFVIAITPKTADTCSVELGIINLAAALKVGIQRRLDAFSTELTVGIRNETTNTD